MINDNIRLTFLIRNLHEKMGCETQWNKSENIFACGEFLARFPVENFSESIFFSLVESTPNWVYVHSCHGEV